MIQTGVLHARFMGVCDAAYKRHSEWCCVCVALDGWLRYTYPDSCVRFRGSRTLCYMLTDGVPYGKRSRERRVGDGS